MRAGCGRRRLRPGRGVRDRGVGAADRSGERRADDHAEHDADQRDADNDADHQGLVGQGVPTPAAA